jgi:hypothetical protein
MRSPIKSNLYKGLLFSLSSDAESSPSSFNSNNRGEQSSIRMVIRRRTNQHAVRNRTFWGLVGRSRIPRRIRSSCSKKIGYAEDKRGRDTHTPVPESILSDLSTAPKPHSICMKHECEKKQSKECKNERAHRIIG